MTVENDGLPPTEAAVHEPDHGPPPGEPAGPLDPPTDLLPLDAASATKLSAEDAAARKAEAETEAGPAAHGTMEGDLFDG